MTTPLNYYHRIVTKWLDEFGVGYIEEYSVGQYSVDIYLPDTKVGVEVDGPQHNKRKDVIRDAAIERATGMRIVRIKVGTKKDRALARIFVRDSLA